MKIILGFIISCVIVGGLALLGISLYNTVEETVEVMQYVPHIMDPHPGIDLSDTLLLHNKK